MFYFIPGQFIALITFSGVMVHELAHELFCYLTGVEVYAVCYFQFDADKSGYVLHAPAKSVIKDFLSVWLLLIVGTVLAIFIFSFGLFLFEEESAFVYPFCLLGGSIGAHAFSSNGDTASLKMTVKEKVGRWELLGCLMLSFFMVDLVGQLTAFHLGGLPI